MIGCSVVMPMLDAATHLGGLDGSDMTIILSFLGFLAFLAALGAIYDRFSEKRRQPPARDAEVRARATIDYYVNVRDSNIQ